MAKSRKSRKPSRRGSNPPSLNVVSSAQFGELRKILDKHPLVLVLVYADWCGHCQHFKPEWKNLAASPTRNMAMVSVRDDVFPKSPLNNLVTPEGFPTVAVVSKPNNVAVNLPSREPNMLNNLVSNADKLKGLSTAAAANEMVAAEVPAPVNNAVRISGEDEETSIDIERPNTAENSFIKSAPVSREIVPPMSEEEYLRMDNVSKYPLPLVKQAAGGMSGSGLWNILQNVGPMQPFSLGGGRRRRTKRKVHRRRRTHRK